MACGSGVLIAAVLGAGLSAMPACGAVIDPDLRHYVGRSRVLLVFAPDQRDPALSRQMGWLAAAADALRSRDVVVVPVVGTEEPTAPLRRRFAPGPGFLAVLVGKDGGAKLTSAEPIAAARLAEVIDAMPMGRVEAGRRRDGQPR